MVIEILKIFDWQFYSSIENLIFSHTKIRRIRIINHWLHHPPEVSDEGLSVYQYLVFDGTFLHRPQSIVAVMNVPDHRLLKGCYGISENSQVQLLSFWRPLQAHGLSPKSCTVDGNPQVLKVLRILWPHIRIQRCLVHIQRQGLMWCRRHPKRSDAKALRDLFLSVSSIKTLSERAIFLSRLYQWEERYGDRINAQPETGKVFSDIKRARSMLIKAVPNMFHYLDDPNIPKSTNSIEGYFSRLKTKYRQHRGLTNKKLERYFQWYFYLNPK